VRPLRRQEVRDIITAIENAEPPVLIHCVHGADRTGVVAVVAAMALAGWDYDRAREQLSLRYLHAYHGTDRIGSLLDDYEDYCRRNGLTTDGWQQFRDWALNVYQPPEP